MSAPDRPPLTERIAGAPISWGVCEVPGWGHQLDVDTVLGQMRDVGIVATEFGPDGFLPDAPGDKAATLSEAGLRAVGQFVPAVLHDPDHDPIPEVEKAIEALVVAGATTVVVAAATGVDGYDDRPLLTDAQWETLLENLDLVTASAEAHGLAATLHPHVGTIVESGVETERVLAGSRISLCLDTGHLLIGGGDPVELARLHPERIAHVHLKDVRLDLAKGVQEGRQTYTDAVADGMYVPLGEGDVDIAAIVRSLEDAGYAGWYVLEQDTVLTGPPSQTGVDPTADVRTSIAHIRAIAQRLESGT
ncbi:MULTISPECIES: TIM barrel protein [unclassified Knoellia]|uniref:TIM barrel protein n=1 Tax=Knoellia altitudinis TaxID=3404795 RepID=UPI00360A2B8F